jgi:voltage-gated potassium channel
MRGNKWFSLTSINRMILVTVIALVGMIAVGTFAYHYLEDWSWISSFYFTVCTLTTVGYGDLAPTSEASRLFTALFALAGVTVAFTSFTILGTMYLRRGENLLSKVGEAALKRS